MSSERQKSDSALTMTQLDQTVQDYSFIISDSPCSDWLTLAQKGDKTAPTNVLTGPNHNWPIRTAHRRYQSIDAYLAYSIRNDKYTGQKPVYYINLMRDDTCVFRASTTLALTGKPIAYPLERLKNLEQKTPGELIQESNSFIKKLNNSFSSVKNYLDYKCIDELAIKEFVFPKISHRPSTRAVNNLLEEEQYDKARKLFEFGGEVSITTIMEPSKYNLPAFDPTHVRPSQVAQTNYCPIVSKKRARNRRDKLANFLKSIDVYNDLAVYDGENDSDKVRSKIKTKINFMHECISKPTLITANKEQVKQQALHSAAYYNNTRLVENLIKQKIEPDSKWVKIVNDALYNAGWGTGKISAHKI